jgi:hypothetical protein
MAMLKIRNPSGPPASSQRLSDWQLIAVKDDWIEKVDPLSREEIGHLRIRLRGRVGRRRALGEW